MPTHTLPSLPRSVAEAKLLYITSEKAQSAGAMIEALAVLFLKELDKDRLIIRNKSAAALFESTIFSPIHANSQLVGITVVGIQHREVSNKTKIVETMRTIQQRAEEIGIQLTNNHMLDSVISTKGDVSFMFFTERHVICYTTREDRRDLITQLFGMLPHACGISNVAPDSMLIKLCTALATNNDAWLISQYQQWYDTHIGDPIEMSFDILKAGIKDNRAQDIGRVQREIESIRTMIDDVYKNLVRHTRELRNYEQDLVRLQLAPAENKAVLELIEYLRAYRRETIIDIATAPSNGIRLTVAGPAIHHDIDVLKTLLASWRTSSAPEIAKRAQWLNDLCIPGGNFQLWLSGSFTIKEDMSVGEDPNLRDVSNIQGFVSNPHVVYLNCMRRNMQAVAAAMKRNDLIMMYEALLGTVGNVAWGDSAATTKLWPAISTADKRNLKTIKDLRTGEFISFSEYRERREQYAQTESNSGRHPEEDTRVHFSHVPDGTDADDEPVHPVE